MSIARTIIDRAIAQRMPDSGALAATLQASIARLNETVRDLRRELADERRLRAEVEQQRDVLQDELRRLVCRHAVEERIG